MDLQSDLTQAAPKARPPDALKSTFVAACLAPSSISIILKGSDPDAGPPSLLSTSSNGLVGLRALATGLPASLLLNPRKVLAGAASCAASDKAQFIIFNTSGVGDPIIASVPGTYDDPNIVHSLDPKMAPATLSLGGQTYTAARPWAMLPREVLDRMTFWHLMTNTPIHPKEPGPQADGSDQCGRDAALLSKLLAPSWHDSGAAHHHRRGSPAEAQFWRRRAAHHSPLALKSTLTSAPARSPICSRCAIKR